MDAMEQFEAEIESIPDAAERFHNNLNLTLPEDVPYIGMGSSYFAAVCLRRAGAPIHVELASEVTCLHRRFQPDEAVLISQSGRSSETVELCDAFQCVRAVTADPESPLAVHPHTREVVDLATGREEGPATRTFFNTLVALYTGHGFDVTSAIRRLREHWDALRDDGLRMGAEIASSWEQDPHRSLVVIGGGANGGVASQAALLMSETTKRLCSACDIAQYDHGFNEAAENTILFVLKEQGRLRAKTEAVSRRVRDHGGAVVTYDVPPVPEALRPFLTMPAINFAALQAARQMGVERLFVVGSKVNES